MRTGSETTEEFLPEAREYGSGEACGLPGRVPGPVWVSQGGVTANAVGGTPKKDCFEPSTWTWNTSY